MINPLLVELALQFLALSLLSIGGANSIIPEMHLRAVDIEHWMTDAEFSQLFALSQAPGPNVLIVSLIGWKAPVSGIGPMLAMCAVIGPHLPGGPAWDRFRHAPLRIVSAGSRPRPWADSLSGYVLTRATITTLRPMR